MTIPSSWRQKGWRQKGRMARAEGPPPYILPPYWRAANFGHAELESRQVYVHSQHVLVETHGIDVMTSRLLLEIGYVVAVFGATPPPATIDRTLRALLVTGQPIPFMPRLLHELYQRYRIPEAFPPTLERRISTR